MLRLLPLQFLLALGILLLIKMLRRAADRAIGNSLGWLLSFLVNIFTCIRFA